MSSSRVLIFANPISGRGKAARLARELAASLSPEFAVDVIHDPPHVVPVDRLAADPARDSILILGGDGTLRAVVAAYQAAAISPPPLLPMPLGTANLMGQYLGIVGRHAADRILPTLRRRQILQLDAGTAQGAPCLLIASVGLDAAVVHALAAVRNGPISKLSYILPTLKTLCSYSFPCLSVRADGREVFGFPRPQPAVAFIGNIPQYGTGFPMLPSARADDGLLDVAVFPASSVADIVRIALFAALRRHQAIPGAIMRKARKIEVTSPAAVPVQVDGEAAGFTPLTVELLPDRLPFLVPV